MAPQSSEEVAGAGRGRPVGLNCHRYRGRMARRTKIIATIGPASRDPATMRSMIEAGMDVARVNLAHGTVEEKLAMYHDLRQASEDTGKRIGILVDLPGPKVRCGEFPAGGVHLDEGMLVRLAPGHGPSSDEVIEVDYETLTSDVFIGDRLSFGDGSVVVVVEEKDADSLKVRIVHGGHLQGRPGVQVPSDRLQLASPTDEDLRMLDVFVEQDVDMVALSFVRSAHDLRRLGVEAAPRGPLTVAKIETQAAVDNLLAIAEEAGAVMVARGDLGAECPLEELPHLQKRIIRECIALGKPTITATQMLESMISSPIPTRAEASDVANAVFDGTSAVMLSGETAIGRDPVLVVRTMSNIARRADEEFDYTAWGIRIGELRRRAVGPEGVRITDALTMGAWRTAAEVDATAILCLTQTGFTVRSVARFRPAVKVLGFSPNLRTVRQLALSWGAIPILTKEVVGSEERVDEAMYLARELGHLRSGDPVVVVFGSSTRTLATNTLRVLRVP
jgi:pyruvate kinase